MFQSLLVAEYDLLGNVLHGEGHRVFQRGILAEEHHAQRRLLPRTAAQHTYNAFGRQNGFHADRDGLGRDLVVIAAETTLRKGHQRVLIQFDDARF